MDSKLILKNPFVKEVFLLENPQDYDYLEKLRNKYKMANPAQVAGGALDLVRNPALRKLKLEIAIEREPEIYLPELALIDRTEFKEVVKWFLASSSCHHLVTESYELFNLLAAEV